MANVRFGSTGADATFSAAGVNAWNRVLLADATASPPPSWTFPDQDATILANGMAASLVSLTLTGLNYGSPSSGNHRFLRVDDSGAVSASDALIYDADYLQSGLIPALVASTPLHIAHTARDVSGAYPVLRSFVTVSPASDIPFAGSPLSPMNVSAAQVRVDISGAKDFYAVTALDAYTTNSGTGADGLSMVGGSLWAENNGANTVSSIIGGISMARQTHAGAVSTDISGHVIDCSDGRDEGGVPGYLDPLSKAGVNVRFTGLKIGGMNLDSMSTQERRGIWIRPMTGTPAGSPAAVDSAIFSEATQPSIFYGPMVLGVNGQNTGNLIFQGAISGTVTVKANPTAGTWSWEIPADDGDSGQFLKTNGSGVSSWAQVPAFIAGNAGGGTVASGSPNSVVYLQPSGQIATSGTVESTRTMVVPFACTFKNFYVNLIGPQPASGNLVITVRKNNVNQAVTITVPAGGAAAQYSDTSNSFSAAAGDLVTYEVVNNASAVSGNIAAYGIQVVPA